MLTAVHQATKVKLAKKSAHVVLALHVTQATMVNSASKNVLKHVALKNALSLRGYAWQRISVRKVFGGRM